MNLTGFFPIHNLLIIFIAQWFVWQTHCLWFDKCFLLKLEQNHFNANTKSSTEWHQPYILYYRYVYVCSMFVYDVYIYTFHIQLSFRIWLPIVHSRRHSQSTTHTWCSEHIFQHSHLNWYLYNMYIVNKCVWVCVCLCVSVVYTISILKMMYACLCYHGYNFIFLPSVNHHYYFICRFCCWRCHCNCVLILFFSSLIFLFGW